MGSKKTRNAGKPAKVKWDRSFEGKLEGFESKAEERYEKKHLRAYIRGHDRFIAGYNTRVVNGITISEPIYAKVRQKLTKIEG